MTIVDLQQSVRERQEARGIGNENLVKPDIASALRELHDGITRRIAVVDLC